MFTCVHLHMCRYAHRRTSAYAFSCVYIYTHSRQTWIHTCIHTCIRTYTYVHTHVHTHVQTHVHIYVHTYAHHTCIVQARTFLRMRMRMYIRPYSIIQAYTHRHRVDRGTTKMPGLSSLFRDSRIHLLLFPGPGLLFNLRTQMVVSKNQGAQCKPKIINLELQGHRKKDPQLLETAKRCF